MTWPVNWFLLTSSEKLLLTSPAIQLLITTNNMAGKILHDLEGKHAKLLNYY